MKWKKEDILDAIIKLRIEKGSSTKSIIQGFLMGELGYKQSYAYSLFREARKQIVELYNTQNKELANEALAQLEDLYEKCIKDKNYKLALDIKKEINKLTGSYEAEKINLNVDTKIEVIRLIGPNDT